MLLSLLLTSAFALDCEQGDADCEFANAIASQINDAAGTEAIADDASAARLRTATIADQIADIQDSLGDCSIDGTMGGLLDRATQTGTGSIDFNGLSGTTTATYGGGEFSGLNTVQSIPLSFGDDYGLYSRGQLVADLGTGETFLAGRWVRGIGGSLYYYAVVGSCDGNAASELTNWYRDSRLESFVSDDVEGCTDPRAINYDPAATIDDGTCAIPGCTDPTALNYNPEATIDDGSCQTLPVFIPGCTDPAASNYNPAANIDDGSCITFPDLIPGCTDPTAPNFNPGATIDDGSCEIREGCTDPSAFNFDPTALIDDGSCLYI